jgi:integrase
VSGQSGHVRKRGSKWWAYYDAGRQSAQRCGPCGRRGVFWAMGGRRFAACPNCGGDLWDLEQRRQVATGGYRSKGEAQAALTEALARLQHTGFVEPSKQTLAQYATSWLESRRGQIRASTLASYERNLRAHVLPTLGNRELRAITPLMLDALYADLQVGRTRSPIGARTTRYVHMILRRCLSDAVRKGMLTRNPADMADPPRPGQPGVMATWSPEQLRTFLASVRNDRLYAAYLLLATTGARRGEVLGLRWDAIDLDASRVSIERTLTTVASRIEWSKPKTAKGRRQLALDPATVAALRDHRRRQLEERMAWGSAYQDQGLVFAREDGSPLHPELFLRAFRQRTKAASVPRIRLHDIRHTYATEALRLGIHPKVVQERLGHSTIAITLDLYSHAIPEMDAEAAARVAAHVLGG